MTKPLPVGVSNDKSIFINVLNAARCEQSRLKVIADKIASDYYAKLYIRRQEPMGRRGNYGPNLQTLKGGIGIYWGKLDFYSSGRAESRGRTRVQVKTFGRKGAWRYLESQFPDAADWELEAISVAESEFEWIRRRTDLLGRIVKAVKNAALLEEDNITYLLEAVSDETEPPGKPDDQSVELTADEW